MISAIILDNDEHFIFTLSKIIKTNFPEVYLAATTSTIKDGVALLNSVKPDLLFLDVELTNEMGFDLFAHFENKIPFDVIFISSHEEFAIKAIKFAALDYILKPVDIAELKAALERFKEKKHELSSKEESINLLLENLHTSSFKKIAFSTSKGIRITQVDSIIRCEADSSYCIIYLTGNEKIVITKNLKDTEELLPPDSFMRIHKSHLVNIHHIKEYNRKDGGSIIMSDNSEIAVSHRKRDMVLDFLKKISS